MRNNVFFSFALHGIFLVGVFFLRTPPRKFEGYPAVMPVEIVELKPVSFKAPEIKKVAVRRNKARPQPKKLEGVTIEKPPLKQEKPEERQPQQEETPEKSDEGKAVTESQGVRLDAREFPFSYYKALLRSRIRTNWEPPVGNAVSKRTLVFFKIQRSGQLTNLAIETSSNDYLFDQAALRAITLANPLPPLPYDFPQRDLGVHFEFEQGR